MTNAQAREGRCVSVTFRGQLPSEAVVQEIRERAALLGRSDMVHAVVLAARPGFEVRVQASSGTRSNAAVARDLDLLSAIAKAFDRLLVAELGIAAPALRIHARLPSLPARARAVNAPEDAVYKQGSC
jgi:hypothetical protein